MSAATPHARIIPALAYGLDLAGVAVFALSGALAGIHRGLDLFGIAVLAAVTGVGGGTTRDLLLNRHPIFWTKNPHYLYAILLAAVIAVLGQGFLPSVEHALLIADAFGLGLVALWSAQTIEAERRPWIVVLVLGTVSGVTGGLIRDVLTGVVPLLLRRDIYATAAIAGIGIYLLLQVARLKSPWAFTIGLITVVAVRLLAIGFAWQLPSFASPNP
jgi:uncharacterized membrane protein YeiH